MTDKKISALDSATTPLVGTEVFPVVQSSTTKKVTIANVTAGRDVSAKSVTGESNGSGSPSEFIARNTAGSERIHLISRNEAGVSYVQVQNAQMIVGTLDNFNAQIRTNNTQRMLFDTSGNVTVSNGNLVVGTAGKGIDFSANTNAAGMTSELLDWYEEGNWTPTISGSSSAGTISYDNRRAEYVRIGTMVMVTVQIDIAVVTSAPTGDLIITGLPFTPKNPGGGNLGLGIYTGSANMDRIDFPNNTTSLCCQAYGDDTNIYIVASGNNVTSAKVQANNLETDDNVQISLCYIVS